jgi:hypothetical protein
VAWLVGCDDNGLRPRTKEPPQAGVSSVPLTVGSAWSYRHRFSVLFKNADGSDAREPMLVSASGTREIVGTEIIDGREYAIEYERVGEDDNVAEAWRRYRQDMEALYRADISIGIPPGEVDTGGEEVGEQLRLRFPLEVGDTWTLRPDDENVILTVEARDTLALALGDTPAFRVRIDAANAGPDDTHTLWYGSLGLLRREVHTETNATDSSTGQVIRIIRDEIDEMTGAELVVSIVNRL